jgi:hypothetical protein
MTDSTTAHADACTSAPVRARSTVAVAAESPPQGAPLRDSYRLPSDRYALAILVAALKPGTMGAP